MCVVSNMGDQWAIDTPQRYPTLIPGTSSAPIWPSDDVSKEEFEALKNEVAELKILLLAAKRFDEATGQKDCEMDEKIEFIRTVAEFVGVDVDDVFGSPE